MTILSRQYSFFVLLIVGSTTSGTWGSPWCMPPPSLALFQCRGGSSVDDASSSSSSSSDAPFLTQLEVIKAQVIKESSAAIEELRRTIVDESVIVEKFGAKADKICNQALEEFARRVPPTDDASVYDRQLEELELALDAPLQVLYLRQLALIREEALQKYRAAVAKSPSTAAADYESMLQADAQFARDARASTRTGGGSGSGSSGWDYSSERAFLQSVMNSIAESAKRSVELQVKSAQQQQTAMQVLQGQQQMIQQLQMQLYGQSSPWNVGVAYRIPDTNFNLQGSYQQGRANVQLSCVPDEYAPMLGPNGFTNGVGPGNLGLSLNLSI